MPIQHAYHCIHHTDFLVLERGVLLERASWHMDIDGLIELGSAECVTNINEMIFFILDALAQLTSDIGWLQHGIQERTHLC